MWNFLLQPSSPECGPEYREPYLPLGVPWILNVNMTYSKKGSLERLPEGAQWLHCSGKAYCCHGNAREVIEFSQSSQESYICIILPIPSKFVG